MGRTNWLGPCRFKLKKVGKTTGPLRYDLNQIPYNYRAKESKENCRAENTITKWVIYWMALTKYWIHQKKRSVDQEHLRIINVCVQK